MKRSNIIGLIGVILAVAVIVSLLSWFLVDRTPTILQGEADATSYKASSKVAGRIEEMLVKEGQRVRKGDLLYILSTPEIDAKLQQAQAAESAASAQQRKANKGARSQEIDAARSLWQQSQAALDLAQKTYQRMQNLYNQGVVPAQTFDEATAQYRAAQSAETAARSQFDLAVEGARVEDRQSAAALVQQAAGAVSEVESYKADSHIYSPADGEVSSVIAEVGELVGQGFPVVSIIDTDDIWFAFNIKETMMPDIYVGRKFMVYVPALDRKIEVAVDYISVQADFATWSATHTQGTFDIRTFNVKTRPTSSVENLRPGMSAIADWDEINLSHTKVKGN